MRFTTLFSGSKGNSALLSEGGTNILIDAGASARRILCAIREIGVSPDGVSAIVVTHDHTDHISALLQLLKRVNAPVYAPPKTARAIKILFPEISDYISPLKVGTEMICGNIAFNSFPTPHDASDSVGYVFSNGSEGLSYATDTGNVTDAMLDACLGADMSVIEANHDREMLLSGRYPERLKKRILSPHGHLSNTESGDFAVKLFEAGAGRIILAHLSEENNTPACALRCVGERLMRAGAVPCRDVELCCASAREPSETFEVKKCSR